MSKKSMLRDTDKDVVTVEALDGGGFVLEVTYPGENEGWGGNYYGLVKYDSLRNLEGKILTIIDASFQDKEQRKAVKDIFRRTFWFDWVEYSIYKGKDSMPVGMPRES
jgi:hypothetical protein